MTCKGLEVLKTIRKEKQDNLEAEKTLLELLKTDLSCIPEIEKIIKVDTLVEDEVIEYGLWGMFFSRKVKKNKIIEVDKSYISKIKIENSYWYGNNKISIHYGFDDMYYSNYRLNIGLNFIYSFYIDKNTNQLFTVDSHRKPKTYDEVLVEIMKNLDAHLSKDII